jgi:hypothetical protein
MTTIGNQEILGVVLQGNQGLKNGPLTSDDGFR